MIVYFTKIKKGLILVGVQLGKESLFGQLPGRANKFKTGLIVTENVIAVMGHVQGKSLTQGSPHQHGVVAFADINGGRSMNLPAGCIESVII